MKKSCWRILRIAPGSSKEDIISAYEKRLEEVNFNSDQDGIIAVQKAYHEALGYEVANDSEEEIENDNEDKTEKTFKEEVKSVGIFAILAIIIKVVLSFLDNE